MVTICTDESYKDEDEVTYIRGEIDNPDRLFNVSADGVRGRSDSRYAIRRCCRPLDAAALTAIVRGVIAANLAGRY